jgi:hypothetical protein
MEAVRACARRGKLLMGEASMSSEVKHLAPLFRPIAQRESTGASRPSQRRTPYTAGVVIPGSNRAVNNGNLAHSYRAHGKALRATAVEEKPDALAHAIEALAHFVSNVEDKLSAELDAVRYRLQ